MNSQDALQKIEEKFGSIEDFAWLLLNDYPEVVDGDYNLQVLAKKLRVPMPAVSKVLNTQNFRSVMSRMVVQSEYTILDEIRHVRSVKKDATNANKNVNVRIAAREHLARLEGRPLNKQDQEVFVPIQINFGTLPGAVEGTPTVTVGSPTFQMARPGQLPPEGARRRTAKKAEGAQFVNGVPRGDELDFYSDESPYADPEIKKASDKDGGVE